MSNDEHDECDACPKCGHESDMMCYWFRVSGPSDGGPAVWTCWECNTLLPSIAALHYRADLAEAAIANCEGDASERRWLYRQLEDELELARTSTGAGLQAFSNMVELLRRCRPFIWRAAQGGKSPHAQDKEDAKALWPLLEDLKND